MSVALLAAMYPGARSFAAQGVLVLRNGNVLQGNVTLDGEHYRIDNAGASLIVPAEQTECACQTLDQAYELRRRDRAGSSPDSHLELAHWCLRHNLLDQAAREILDVRTSDPGNQQLVTLDRLLRQRMELRTAEARAAATSTANAKPAAAPPEVTVAAASDLDLSTEVQAQFVRSIQPMLIHSCATGGCHQPESRQQLQLDRWALEGRGSATLIRRNLASVTAQVNKDDPASSPLVLRGRQAHGVGNTTSTPLAPYQAALLLEWLNRAAGIEPQPSMESESKDSLGAVGDERVEAEPQAGTDEIEPATAIQQATEQPFKPRDAFDPEIFNRRFARRAVGNTRRPSATARQLPASSAGPPTEARSNP